MPFIPSIIETSLTLLNIVAHFAPVCRLTRRADPRMCPGTSWGRARGSRGRLCPRTRRTSGLWTGPAPSPRRALAFRVFSLANRRLSYLLIGQRRERGTTSEMEKLVLTVIFWFNRCLIVKWPLIIPAASRPGALSAQMKIRGRGKKQLVQLRERMNGYFWRKHTIAVRGLKIQFTRGGWSCLLDIF